MGSHITYKVYALVLPHTYERQPEDGQDRNMLP